MKKIIFMGVMGLFLLGSCNNHHDNHNHAAEGHNHAAENPEHHHHEHGHEADAHGHKADAHGHKADAHGHKAEGSHAAGGSDEIVLTPEKAQAAGVESAVIHHTIFQQAIKTSGEVLAAQGDESVVVATVAGVVSFRNQVIAGMSVSKGTPLLTLSSQNLAEGDPVQKARVAYETAKKEYDRMAALLPDKIVSEREFAQAEEAYENARISYEAVAKHHSANGQSVTAPLAGYVKELLVSEGDYVSVGQPLVSITQNRRLFLRADVSEKYYASLKYITSANFCTPYNNKVYALSALNGRLLSYGKATGDGNYFVPVTFEFDNKVDVIPGSFVEIYLLSTPIEDAIILPRTAITEEQGSHFVYRQLDAECYQKQLVTLGADNGESVQILSGVHDGDKIVTRGAYQVKLASATNAIPAHSHEH